MDMLPVARCPECSVPEPLAQGQMWLDNGDIVQRLNPSARVGFMECENLDPVFRNLGEIIGMTIEPLVVKITARAVEYYMRRFIPGDVKEKIIRKELDPEPLAAPINTYCQVLGYGKYEYLRSRYERDEDDFSVFRVTRPFSVPLVAGALAGALSSIVGGEHEVTYREVSPEVFEFTTSWTEYPEVVREKFTLRHYQHKRGDLELERCPVCGVPAAFREYRWEIEEGLIFDGKTGRRMAVLGPEILDHLFEALEDELGSEIPQAVVEAQRRFTRTGYYSADEVQSRREFREQLALRGMGNLREIEMSERGLVMHVENAAGYLLLVGTMQGFYELAYKTESRVEWLVSRDGFLEVRVTPTG